MPALKFSLFTKILLWFFFSLFLLAGTVWLVFSISFRFDASFFNGMTNQLDTVSRVIIEELNGKTRAQKDEILKSYSDAYKVNFLVYDNQGRQLGGVETKLPTEVLNAILFPESGLKTLENPAKDFSPTAAPPPKNPPPGDLPPGRSSLSIYVKTNEPTLYWSGTRFMLSEPRETAPLRARLLAVSDSISGHGLFFDLTPWLLIAAVIFVGSAFFWLPFVRDITRTVAQMSAATEQIADGDFNVHVNENRTDELGNLSAGINHLARRLSGFVTGQKRFLSDISHELNSPLARMQVALSILETRVKKEDQIYVEDVKEEVELMSKLVRELLTYSKAGMTAPLIKLERVCLQPLIARLVERETATQRTEIEIDIARDLTVSAHSELLSRALSNIIANAVRYAGQAGTISISANRAGDQVEIVIADQGAGVPETALEKLFDPFYRIESDRSRITGGTGLGLAIVKTCVEAFQGKVFAANRIPTGLVITIVLSK